MLIYIIHQHKEHRWKQKVEQSGLTLPLATCSAASCKNKYKHARIFCGSMRTGLFALALVVVLFAGCFPFGGTQRKIVGDYRLEKFEDGITYYLHKSGHDDSGEGGSIIEGIVVRIGWNSRHIVAQRHAFFGGDPDGWMIIDIQTGNISGPFTDEQLQSRDEVRGIVTYSAAVAWNSL